MKRMVISIFLLLMPLASAINYTLSFDDVVPYKESTITIVSSDSSISDVKIFIERDSQTLSEIYDGSWKSPFHYIAKAYPERKSFKIRTNYTGAANLCARLRKPAKSAFSEVCYPITIEEKKEKPQINVSAEIKAEVNIQPLVESAPAKNETILLKSSAALVTEEGKTERTMIAGFAVVCVSVIIFLAWNKL
ncbi:hypothetical protein KW805_03180 [Candidatus Pacearchaeota archaeon]|nr:hypothetical protein [Candidatus Pacearchaeota archaeon]